MYDRRRAVCSLTHWGTWLPFPWVYRPLVSLLLHHQARMQGLGRHTWAEVFQFGYEDLRALSIYLGELCCAVLLFSVEYVLFWIYGVML